jgi:hypothetical protein
MATAWTCYWNASTNEPHRHCHWTNRMRDESSIDKQLARDLFRLVFFHFSSPVTSVKMCSLFRIESFDRRALSRVQLLPCPSSISIAQLNRSTRSTKPVRCQCQSSTATEPIDCSGKDAVVFSVVRWFACSFIDSSSSC